MYSQVLKAFNEGNGNIVKSKLVGRRPVSWTFCVEDNSRRFAIIDTKFIILEIGTEVLQTILHDGIGGKGGLRVTRDNRIVSK